MEGEHLITETVMKLLENLDDETFDGFSIIDCGIVIVLDSEEYTTVRTRSSTDKAYRKRGMWEMALESVKS